MKFAHKIAFELSLRVDIEVMGLQKYLIGVLRMSVKKNRYRDTDQLQSGRVTRYYTLF